MFVGVKNAPTRTSHEARLRLRLSHSAWKLLTKVIALPADYVEEDVLKVTLDLADLIYLDPTAHQFPVDAGDPPSLQGREGDPARLKSHTHAQSADDAYGHRVVVRVEYDERILPPPVHQLGQRPLEQEKTTVDDAGVGDQFFDFR